MTTRRQAPGARRTLGTIPDTKAVKRDATNKDRNLEEVGTGLQTSQTVNVPAGESVTIRHGLEALPAGVTLTPSGAPAPNVFLASQDRTGVVVTNAGGSDEMVQVNIFG